MPLLSTLLDQVNEELSKSNTRTLSDQTVQRIADLSLSFKPYKMIKTGSFEKAYSPERGQLLINLFKMKIANSSLKKIRRLVTFKSAFLENAHLENLDLSGIDLNRAYLHGAILNNTNLDSASLVESIFINSELQNSSLRYANLKRVKMDRANMPNSDLSNATLEGVTAMSCNMRSVNLSGALIMFNYFSNAEMFKSSFKNSKCHFNDFSFANMASCDFSEVDILRCILYQTNLENARVDEDWNDKLSVEMTGGATLLSQNFKLTEIDTMVNKYFILKRIY
jgi:uncharacterized protein YjbI with pentapeptide repeats